MKKHLTKKLLLSICLISCLTANDNIKRSLTSTNLSSTAVTKYNISKDMMNSLQEEAIVNIANSLDIDTSLFDKRKKFSMYLRVSKKSKIGFRYKF